jgi:hypothetical protein
MVHPNIHVDIQPDIFVSDADFCSYTKELTGYAYHFKYTPIRYWNDNAEFGIFYTLAPSAHDDGFYEWYNFTFPTQQAFRNKTEALLRFTSVWVEWNKTKGQNLFK